MCTGLNGKSVRLCSPNTDRSLLASVLEGKRTKTPTPPIRVFKRL